MSKYSLASIKQDVAYEIIYIEVLELWIDMRIESSYSAGQTVLENDFHGKNKVQEWKYPLIKLPSWEQLLKFYVLHKLSNIE